MDRVRRLHLRVLNLLARVFGLSAVVAALGFTAWGVYFLLHPEAVATHDVITLSGHAALDSLGAGVFCLVLAILFLTVRPYRPDIGSGDGAGAKRRLTWWTGEPR